MVGGDGVPELGEHPRTTDVGDRRGLGAHPLEVRGLAHVGGVRVPVEGVALGGGQGLPALVAGEDVGVVLGEHLGADALGDGALDVGRCGPDVVEEHVVAVGVLSERLGLEVEVHRAREGIGDHQGRRREVVHLDVGVDPMQVVQP